MKYFLIIILFLLPNVASMQVAPFEGGSGLSTSTPGRLLYWNNYTSFGENSSLFWDITNFIFSATSASTTKIFFPEISTPSNPPANMGLLYVKDDGAGTTLPYFLDSSGNETELSGGGGGGGGCADLDCLSDVTITSPALNHLMSYNGSAWVNGAFSHANLTATGTNSHDDIDTHIASTTFHVGPDTLTQIGAMPLSYLDTDTTLSADSDAKVPSQKAIKTYTDNLLLGITWRQPVASTTLSTPPSGPQTGERFIVVPTGTGAWSGQDNDIATWGGASWSFEEASAGWAVVSLFDDTQHAFNGTDWVLVNAGSPLTASNGIQRLANDLQILHTPTTSGLSTSTDELAVNYDDSSIGIVASQLAVKALGITNAMLAGAIDLATKVTGILGIGNGGTGLADAPTTGELLIGKTDGTYIQNTLTAGTDISITSGDGVITINSTASGGGSGGSSGVSDTVKATTTVKMSDEVVNNSDTLQDDDDLSFYILANETWSFRFVLPTQSSGVPDVKFAVTAPTGASCDYTVLDVEQAVSNSVVTTCGTGSSLNVAPGTNVLEVTGTVTNGSTAGQVRLQWAQNVADASDTTVYTGAYVHALSTAMAAGGVINAGLDGQVAYYKDSGTTLSATSTLFVENNLVGVNNNTPDHTLDVVGTAEISGHSTLATASSTSLTVSGSAYLDQDLIFTSTSGNGIRMTRSDGTNSVRVLSVPTSGSGFILANSTSIRSIGGNAIQLLPNNGSVDGLTVSSTGKVGISTTSPTGLLQIDGTGDAATGDATFRVYVSANETATYGAEIKQNSGNRAAMLIEQSAGSGTGRGLIVNSVAATGNILEVQDGGTSVFTVENGGQVGIGTSAPGKLLDISNTGGTADLRLTSSAGNVIHQISTEYDIVYSRTTGAPNLDFQALPLDTTSGASYRFGLSSGSSGENALVLFAPNSTTIASRIGTASTVFNENAADNNFRIEGSGSPNLFFVDAGTNRVGLGTNAPGVFLDVEGDYRFRGGNRSLFWNNGSVQFSLTQVAGATPALDLDANLNIEEILTTDVLVASSSATFAGEVDGAPYMLTCGLDSAVFADSGDVYMESNGVTMSTTKGFVTEKDGSIISASLHYDVDANSGSADFRFHITKGGAKVFTIDLTDTVGNDKLIHSAQTRGIDSFTESDVLGCVLEQFSDSESGTLTDVIGTLRIHYD